MAVPRADEIVPLINQLQKKFDLVVATQDWHPQDHSSFASSHGKKVGETVEVDGMKQILWPDHCIAGSKGAAFVKELHTKHIAKVFHKGTDKEIDSYSAFFDNARKRSTGLENYLKEQNIQEAFIAGLATDYCVKYSALDAVKLGFKVNVIEDACRGIDRTEGDVKRSLEEMREAGVKVIQSRDLIGE